MDITIRILWNDEFVTYEEAKHRIQELKQAADTDIVLNIESKKGES